MNRSKRFVLYKQNNVYECEYLISDKGLKYIVDFDSKFVDEVFTDTILIQNNKCKFYVSCLLDIYRELDRSIILWFVQEFSPNKKDSDYLSLLSDNVLERFSYKSCLGFAFFLSSINLPVSAGKIFKYLVNTKSNRADVNLQKYVRKFMYDYSDNHYLLSLFYIENKAYLIKQANSLYKENGFLEAVIYLEKIVNHHKDENYSTKLLLAYTKSMQYYKAEGLFTQFTDAQKAQAITAKGYLSLVQMKYQDAINYYEVAIKKHLANNISWCSFISQLCMKPFKGKQVTWYKYLSTVASNSGLSVAGRKDIVNLISIKIDMLISLGKEKEVIKESYRITNSLRPDFFKAYENLFNHDKNTFYKSLRKLKNKIFYFGKLISFGKKINNNSTVLIKLEEYMVSLQIALGRCYLLDMQLLKARDIFSQLFVNYKAVRALEWLAYTNYCLTEYDKSLVQYQTVLLSKPNRVPVILQILRIHTELEQYDQAIECMNTYINLLENNKNKDKSHLARRNLYYLTKDFRKAWLAFRDRGINRSLELSSDIDYVQNIFSLKPTQSILILAEWGPGDEIRWASIYPELEIRFNNLVVGCDSRLQSIFQRSFPNITFLPIRKKIRGKVLPEIYDDLSNVPNVTLTQVLDNTAYDFAIRQDAVTLISDVLAECRSNVNNFVTHSGMLATDDNLRAYMQQWLNTLPKNKLNVGICWKSGLIDPMRSIHYSELDLWGDILSLENINFINLQYANYEDDIDKIYQKFGIKIHNPNIDLRDDFDSVAALMSCLDIIISPATAVAELAGMVGTKTLLFTNSVEVDWRVLPNEVDLWHSSIKHIRADRGLIKEEAQKSIVQKISCELKKNLF